MRVILLLLLSVTQTAASPELSVLTARLDEASNAFPAVVGVYVTREWSLPVEWCGYFLRPAEERDAWVDALLPEEHVRIVCGVARREGWAFVEVMLTAPTAPRTADGLWSAGKWYFETHGPEYTRSGYLSEGPTSPWTGLADFRPTELDPTGRAGVAYVQSARSAGDAIRESVVHACTPGEPWTGLGPDGPIEGARVTHVEHAALDRPGEPATSDYLCGPQPIGVRSWTANYRAGGPKHEGTLARWLEVTRLAEVGGRTYGCEGHMTLAAATVAREPLVVGMRSVWRQRLWIEHPLLDAPWPLIRRSDAIELPERELLFPPEVTGMLGELLAADCPGPLGRHTDAN